MIDNYTVSVVDDTGAQIGGVRSEEVSRFGGTLVVKTGKGFNVVIMHFYKPRMRDRFRWFTQALRQRAAARLLELTHVSQKDSAQAHASTTLLDD